MAYITIPQLPLGSDITGLEQFESVQSGQSVKLTANQMKTFVSTDPTFVVADAATNTVTNVITLEHTTSGVVAPGFGVGLEFASENGVGAIVNSMTIQSVCTDPNSSAEDFDFVLQLIVDGTPSEVARITSTYRLGLGTNAPAATFHGISSDTNVNSVSSGLRLEHLISTGSAGNGIGVGVDFIAENNAGVAKLGATIDAVEVDVSSGAEDFDLVFGLMAAGAPVAEVMRIKSIGYVGIGTQLPSARLEVFNLDTTNAAPTTAARFTHATSGVPAVGIGTAIDFVTETSSSVYKESGAIYTESTDLSLTLEDFDMAFAIMIDGIAGVEVMRVTSDKYLGINTSAPVTTLHAFREDAVTNTVSPVLRLAHGTVNTPAIGIGSSIEIETETTNGNFQIGGVIESVSTVVAALTEEFDMVFKTMTAGAAATEKLRVGEVVYTPKPFGAGTVPTADAWIHAGAGTTATAAIEFDPGVLLTTPNQGAMEFDGRNIFITPFGLQRSVFNAPQVFQLENDRTAPDIVNNTSVQSIFGKSVGVNDNTRYQFQINATFRATSATAKNIGFAVGGTAVINILDYESSSFFAAATTTVTASYMMGSRRTASFTSAVQASVASGAAAGYFTLRIRGSVDVATAGTLDFSFNYSAAPTVGTVQAGSSMWLWATGPIGADTSIGDWT